MCLNPYKIVHPAHKHVTSPVEGLPSEDWSLPYKEFRSSLSPSFMEVPCGRCVECRKSRGSSWRVRLLHELHFDSRVTMPLFVTLTFDSKYYAKYKDDPQSAIRHFTDSFRKRYKYSMRYFMVTELGGDGDRLHFHGIIFNPPFRRRTNPSYKVINRWLRARWRFGITWTGWVNDATCNYILKYITKLDENHPDFFGRVYVSPGLGRSYLDAVSTNYIRSQWNTSIKVHAGNQSFPCPRYYINKVFSQYERQLRLLYRDVLDPPDPLVFRKHRFSSLSALIDYRRSLFEDSVARHLSADINCFDAFYHFCNSNHSFN